MTAARVVRPVRDHDGAAAVCHHDRWAADRARLLLDCAHTGRAIEIRATHGRNDAHTLEARSEPRLPMLLDVLTQAGNDENRRLCHYAVRLSEPRERGVRFGAKPFFASASSALW